MQSFKEIEWKSIMQREDFYMLLSELQSNSITLQLHINHYFDTKNLDLFKNKISVRIREDSASNELTIKHKSAFLGEGRISTEHTTFLDNESLSYYLEKGIEIEKFEEINSLGKLESSILFYLGSLNTKRFECIFGGSKIHMDISTFFNVIDYELEFETSNPNLAYSFEERYRRFGIRFNAQSEGKYTRFIAMFKKLNGLNLD